MLDPWLPRNPVQLVLGMQSEKRPMAKVFASPVAVITPRTDIRETMRRSRSEEQDVYLIQGRRPA